MFSTLRRISREVPKFRRGMAGHGHYEPVPKPDTSMDHVFGDSSYKLPFNFEPLSMGTTFWLTVATFGVFGFPIWRMVYDEYRMEEFEARLAAARAKRQAQDA